MSTKSAISTALGFDDADIDLWRFKSFNLHDVNMAIINPNRRMMPEILASKNSVAILSTRGLVIDLDTMAVICRGSPHTPHATRDHVPKWGDRIHPGYDGQVLRLFEYRGHVFQSGHSYVMEEVDPVLRDVAIPEGVTNRYFRVGDIRPPFSTHTYIFIDSTSPEYNGEDLPPLDWTDRKGGVFRSVPISEEEALKILTDGYPEIPRDPFLKGESLIIRGIVGWDSVRVCSKNYTQRKAIVGPSLRNQYEEAMRLLGLAQRTDVIVEDPWGLSVPDEEVMANFPNEHTTSQLTMPDLMFCPGLNDPVFFTSTEDKISAGMVDVRFRVAAEVFCRSLDCARLELAVDGLLWAWRHMTKSVVDSIISRCDFTQPGREYYTPRVNVDDFDTTTKSGSWALYRVTDLVAKSWSRSWKIDRQPPKHWSAPDRALAIKNSRVKLFISALAMSVSTERADSLLNIFETFASPQ